MSSSYVWQERARLFKGRAQLIVADRDDRNDRNEAISSSREATLSCGCLMEPLRLLDSRGLAPSTAGRGLSALSCSSSSRLATAPASARVVVSFPAHSHRPPRPATSHGPGWPVATSPLSSPLLSCMYATRDRGRLVIARVGRDSVDCWE